MKRLLGVVLVLVGSASPAVALNRAPDWRARSVIDRAGYSVSPEAGGPRTVFTATLTNEGLSEIEFGAAYGLDIRRNGRWAEVPSGRYCAWPSILYRISPGGSHDEDVDAGCSERPLKPGRYRVSKYIEFTDDVTREHRPEVMRAFFEVKS